MLSVEILKDLVHEDELSHQDRLLLCLANSKDPKFHKDIKEIGLNVGLTPSVLNNITSYLKKAKGFAIQTPKGWELTKKGLNRVKELSGIEFDAPKLKVAGNLRGHLSDIKDDDTREFVEQAIKCMELSLHRAAVVLSWVGAISLLYDFVLANKLVDFNNEAMKRDAKWKRAKSKDDLSKMKEYDFLQILVAISVVGKNVKDELEICLKLRNGCGHPNSLKIGDSRVSAHIETLMLNVFSKFS